MIAWDFIEATAAELGVSAEAVRKWRIRGVPYQWRLRLLDIADAAGFSLDRREFDRPPGPKRAAPEGNPAIASTEAA